MGLYTTDEFLRLAERSVYHPGNPAPFAALREKLECGGDIRLAYLGGSVTEGAGASSYGKAYATRVSAWFRHTWPDARFAQINAGIGNTGSVLGLHRLEADILRHRPDLVVVDFTINDLLTETRDRHVYYEYVLRGLAEAGCAVICLFMNRWDGESDEDIHGGIARHYDLPVVSYKTALWSDIQSGRIRWEDIAADTWHPGDTGHALIAGFLTAHLETLLGRCVGSTPAPLPQPLSPHRFLRPRLLHSDNCAPVSHGGWDPFRQTLIIRPGWMANGSAAPLVIETEACNVGLVYRRYSGGTMGRARFVVDGTNAGVAEGHIPEGWGEHAFGEMLAQGLEPGTHLLELFLDPAHHPDSRERDFMLCGLLIS